MSRRISSRVEDWTENAIEKYGLNDKDQVSYEILISLGQQGPQMAFVTFMPSGIIGMLVSSFTLIDNPAMITESEVDDLVKGNLEALRQARSEALSNSGGGEVIASLD
jgi:hypothetical protein